MRIPHSPSFNFTNGVTVSGWLQTSGTADFSGLFDKFSQEGLVSGFQVSLSGDNGFPPNRAGILRADLGLGTTYATAFNLTAVSDGAPHHFALTCDGREAVLYVDGEPGLRAPVTNWVANNTTDIVLGHDDPISGRHFLGRLDEVALYERALGPRDIQALAGKPVLEIALTAPDLATISWPATASAFLLQVNDTLSPAGWTDAPSGTNKPVTVSTSASTRYYRLRSIDPRLTTVESISPADGDTGVAVNRATVIQFTRPVWLLDEANTNDVYAVHGENRLLLRREFSPDRRTLTLFYENDLPALARIQVVVDGGFLIDETGDLLDANANGVPGGVRVAEFQTQGDRPLDGDADGLDDASEVALGTDTALWDTDGDGFGDGTERLADYDPLSPESRPGILLEELPGTILDLMTNFPAYGPFPVAPDAMTAEGLVRTRIAAVLNPNATPAIVNEALNAAGLRIVTMRPGMPFVTLALPARPNGPYDASEIQAIAEALVQSSDLTPFLSARLAYAAGPRLTPGGPDSPAARDLAAHDLIRMPAAWNLRAASNPTAPVKVLVPDYYADDFGHPQLPNQEFVPAVSGRTPRVGAFTPDAAGNHGYAVVSALASRFDFRKPTGTLPTADVSPMSQVVVLSMPVGGLTLGDCVYVIGDALARERPDILSTSLGFIARSPASNSTRRAARIELALQWRAQVRRLGFQFTHFAAAGNESVLPDVAPDDQVAEFDSPWNLAARRGSLDEMLLGATNVSSAEVFGLVYLVNSLESTTFGLLTPLDNVLIVGSVDASGSPSEFTEPGEDVLARGEGLTLACAGAGPGPSPGSACDGVLATGCNGTSFATPQAAGVAAYLLTLKRDLTPAQLRDVLMGTRDGNLLDAYRAVLDLDWNDSAVPLRRRLLDVAGGSAEDASGVRPDGKFDEKDLEAFVNAFNYAEALRETGSPPDRSRFDLNGDGYTGGPGKSGLILDPAADAIGSSYFRTIVRNIRNVPVEFDETALTDLQILCFYAYAGFYTGSESERGRVLGAGCCPLPPLIAFKAAGRYPPDSTLWTSVHVINALTGAGGAIIEGTGGVGGPAWRPDGGELAFWAGNGNQADIFAKPVGTAEAETTTMYQLVPGPADDFMPVYLRRETPSGDRLFFVRFVAGANVPFVDGNGQPRGLAGYGTGQGVRFPAGSWGQQESVSPNNEFAYVYAEGASSAFSIRTVTPFGGERVIAEDVGTVFGAAWSPDGQSLAFGSLGRLQLVSNQTLEVRTLDTNSVTSIRVSWSPDGRYIAYRRGNPANGMRGEIYAFDLTGGRLLNFGPGEGPAWSPDGKEIAFIRDADVWVRTIETGAERQLTFTPNFSEEGIVWRPGPQATP